jgi:hypothetical protein
MQISLNQYQGSKEEIMYGYGAPKKHERASLRVIVCESELERFMERFPMLTREEVLLTLINAGPMRSDIEHELARLAESTSGRVAQLKRQ